MNDDIEYDDTPCPKCGCDSVTQRCQEIDCEDGYVHDCGEDWCPCLYPGPNTPCPECKGRGFHRWCRKCGWDLNENRYLNGRSELALNPAKPVSS